MSIESFDTPDVTFNVGPSELMPEVDEYMAEGVELSRLGHRSPEFAEIFANTDSKLRELLDIPKDYMLGFVSSASHAMNLTVHNTVEHRSAHIVNGAFSQRWQRYSEMAGKTTVTVEVGWGEGLDLQTITLGEIFNTGVIAVTATETSTGVTHLTDKLADIGRDGQLKQVDLTSFVPGKIDFETLDTAFFSVYKAFGMPPGLGVIIASPRAVKRSAELAADGFDVGGYQSFTELWNLGLNYQTPEGPNIPAIYALGKVAEDMLQNPNLQEEIEGRARKLYDFFDARPGLQPFVRENRLRSSMIIVVDVQGGSAELVSKLRALYNIEVGRGYGDKKNKQIRIANFPAHTDEEIVDLIQMIDELADSSDNS